MASWMMILFGGIFFIYCKIPPAFSTNPFNTDSSCYHRFNTTNRGIFHTPNFPNNYDVKKRCGWEIIAPENTADITITFNTFKVEPSKRCRYYDHMMIYRKAFGQTNWETIGFQEGYCGEQIPFQISSSTKRIFVLFVSDDTQVFQGFNATYEIRITQAKPKITCLGKNGLPTADACKRDIITEETDPLMVNCVAESIPPPTFEWKMQNKSNPTGSYIPLPTRIVQNFLSNGSLQLKAGAVQRSDQNIYRCIAKNKLGQAEADFNLTVLEKCKCPKEITTNWYNYAPYTRFISGYDTKTNSPIYKGILYTVLTKMMQHCCGNCSGGHGPSSINWGDFNTKKEWGIADVKKAIEDSVWDLSFPIGGGKHDDKYRQSYWFVPTIESPGVAFIVVGDEPGTQAKAIFDSVLQGWPVLVLTVVMAVLAGIIMWGLDTYWNEEQFPRSFTEGIVEGFWWAFVTMTTVGYGDIAPVGVPGRVFAIVWILTGLVIISIFTGVITTSLTVVTLSTDVKLYGAKVGAINNTAEFRLGLIKNAKMTNVTTYAELRDLMTARKVKGVLVDSYVGAHHKNVLGGSSFRVSKIISSSSAFGVVLGPRLSAKSLYQCFASYVEQRKQEITADIEKNTETLQEPAKSAAEQKSTGLFDASSDLFKNSVIVTSVLLIVFSLGGLLFEYGYLRPRQRMIEAAKNLEMVESVEVKEMAKRAQLMKEALLEEVTEFYNRWNENISNLRKKHKEQQRLLAERQKGGKTDKVRPASAQEAMEMEQVDVAPSVKSVKAFEEEPQPSSARSSAHSSRSSHSSKGSVKEAAEEPPPRTESLHSMISNAFEDDEPAEKKTDF